MTLFLLGKGDFNSELLSQQLIGVSQLEIMVFPSKRDLPHYRMKTRKMINLLRTIKRYENNLHSKQSSSKLPEKDWPTGPRTLIVGSTAVNGIKNFCNKKNTEGMISTSNVVSDISENILAITE
ncbi:hypothetical protein ILYODFUR_029054 [Ilyodon furcidens]|uniref:Uncharacterized protein n=1 Tax=Ilyodon furcidens TaxID=33524 RepID=A0ABV0SQ43_9TELE